MPTIQKILDFGDRFYPKSSLVSVADRVSDLNDLHKDIYITIQKLKNDYDINSVLFTTIDNIFYAMPNNCRIDDIIKIMVATDSLATNFEEYKYAGLSDDVTIGNYYGRALEGTFFLIKDSLPIQKIGLQIQVYFYPRPTELSESDLTAIPDLDEDYHDLLKFGFIQTQASQGHDPDTEIADHWQKEYDNKLGKVMNSLEERINNAPTRRPESRERM